MTDFAYTIFNMSTMAIFLLTSAAVVGFSLLTTLFSRSFFTTEKLNSSNQWISVANSVSSQIIAVLLGFAIYSLFNNCHDAEVAAHQEAKALRSINVYSKNLTPATHSLIEQEVKKYAQIVIDKEWPEMARGENMSEEAEGVIQKMRVILYSHPSTTPFQKGMVDNILEETKTLCQQRDDRIDLSTKGLKKETLVIIWFVSLLCVFLFSIDGGRLRFHLILSISLSLIVAANLFLTVVLDRPFAGPFAIQPEPFHQILRGIGSV